MISKGVVQFLHGNYLKLCIKLKMFESGILIGGIMIIVCSQCNATYKIMDNKITSKKAVATCKKCGGRIAIEPGTPPEIPEKLEIDHDYGPPSAGKPFESQVAANHPGTLLNEFPEVGEYSPKYYSFGDILVLNRKGGFKSRRNKFKLKLLGAVKEVLEKMLIEKERVLKIAAGTAYYPAEIFFGNGWLTMLYNRYVIIGTNRRLLMINVNHRMNRPTHYIFQFLYTEIRKIGRGLLGTSLILYRKNKGKRRIFTNLKRFISRELNQFLNERIAAVKKLRVPDESLENICPACYVPLKKGLAACPRCNAVFKSPKKAMLRSLILPGWGDIYLGHRVLGALELLSACFIWLLVLSSLLSGLAEDLIAGAMILTLFNGMDCLLTYYMAQKGCSLEKNQSAMPMQTQPGQNPATISQINKVPTAKASAVAKAIAS
jgi:predicted Zn finger-like uncharacterized protein